MRILRLFAILALCSVPSWGTIYYIAATGADTNNGTAKGTPWLHAPGMTNCSNTCASTTPVAGDSIIFRGGDTWHFGNNALTPYVGAKSWTFGQSGGAGNVIYIGVDVTWFAGASFARPIFNGDDTVTTATVASCTYDYGITNVFSVGTQTHLRLDNIEWTGFCYDGTTNDPNEGNVSFGGTDTIVENMYFHGMTITTGTTHDEHASIHGNGSGFKGDLTQICEFNVFDNSDGSFGTTGTYPSGKASTEGIQNGCGVVAFNVFNRVSNGIVGTSTLVHDNLFHDMYEPQGSVHGNIWNSNNDGLVNVGSQGFYNNVFYNINEGVSVWLMPTPTAYIFNNVEWNNSNSANCYMIGGTSTASPGSTTLYFYDNTSDAPCNLRALFNGNDPPDDPHWNGVVHFSNNHYIGYSPAVLSSTYDCDASAVCTWTDDDPASEIFQTEAVANGQGYTKSNFYAPTSGTNATVGQGGNYTTSCSTFSPGSELCSGTTRGVTEVSGSGGMIASSPAIPIIARPGGASAWDSGAYEFLPGPVATPSFLPVAGTYTGSQSVTISSTAGATIGYTTDGSTPTANGAGTITHGTVYTVPVSVATSETLKAVGSKSGSTDSAVGSAAYTINYLLTVTLSGSGAVTSADTDINCPTTCSFAYASGATSVLTATPSGGFTFTGWSGGGCSGNGTCTVTMSSAQAVTATFVGSTPVAAPAIIMSGIVNLTGGISR